MFEQCVVSILYPVAVVFTMDALFLTWPNYGSLEWGSKIDVFVAPRMFSESSLYKTLKSVAGKGSFQRH